MSETLLEEFDHEGIKCEIHFELYPENPYKQFDQASEILSDVKDYDLGGKVPHPESVYRDTPPSKVMARYLTMFDDYALAIPWKFQDYGSGGARVYLFEPDEDAADGWLVLTKEAYEREFGNMPLHDNGEEFSAEKTVRSEFAAFKAYIEGDVFGWRIAPGTSEEDSCWGYYGELDYVREEAKRQAEWLAEERKRQRSFPWMGFLNPGMPSGRNV